MIPNPRLEVLCYTYNLPKIIVINKEKKVSNARNRKLLGIKR